MPNSNPSVPHPDVPRQLDLNDSIFLRACRGLPVPYTPVWLMRQAGRYQPEYRSIRSKVSFLELCKTPDLAAEVTVFAAEQLGVDAAIIFADILLILEPMGIPISFENEGEGPRILRPIRTASDIDMLESEIFPEQSLHFVMEAIGKVRASLPHVPLLGFAGAPFTLASYMIEGRGSKHYVNTKSLMYGDEGAFQALMRCLSEVTVRYLNAQITAGANAVQLFDSWVGALSPEDYRRYVFPSIQYIMERLPSHIPTILFGTSTGSLLEDFARTGASVVGVDWRVDMADAAQRLPQVALQGNLDPVVLFAPIAEIRKRVQSIVSAMRNHYGHIFNLGHGILPNTPVEHVKALVAMVHEQSMR